jgi:hypothetical protein
MLFIGYVGQVCDTYRKTIQLIRVARAHPEERVPDEVPAELVKAILAARAEGG